MRKGLRRQRRGEMSAAAGRPRADTLVFALSVWLNVTGGTHHVALLSLGGRKCRTQGQYREQELADPAHGVNLTDTAPNADERELLARWRVGAGARRRTPAPTPPLLLAALRRELGAVVHHDAAGVRWLRPSNQSHTAPPPLHRVLCRRTLVVQAPRQVAIGIGLQAVTHCATE